MIGASSVSAASIEGLWLTENGKAIIQFSKCEEGADSKFCGNIVWSQNPRDEDGNLKLDVNNPDPALKSRPVCGIRLIGDLQKTTEDFYEDGWVYHPKKGKSYGAEVTVVSAEQLEMRGFLGFSLIGKSETWNRVEDNRTGC